MTKVCTAEVPFSEFYSDAGKKIINFEVVPSSVLFLTVFEEPGLNLVDSRWPGWCGILDFICNGS